MKLVARGGRPDVSKFSAEWPCDSALDAVAGVVEESDTARLQPVPELDDGAAHVLLGHVLPGDHVEAELAQCLRDASSVVDGVPERRGGIGRVPDHQRQAFLASRALDGDVAGLSERRDDEQQRHDTAKPAHGPHRDLPSGATT